MSRRCFKNSRGEEDWIKDSPDPISALAEEFQVSENFMRKRLEFREIVNLKIKEGRCHEALSRNCTSETSR